MKTWAEQVVCFQLNWWQISLRKLLQMSIRGLSRDVMHESADVEVLWKLLSGVTVHKSADNIKTQMKKRFQWIEDSDLSLKFMRRAWTFPFRVFKLQVNQCEGNRVIFSKKVGREVQ